MTDFSSYSTSIAPSECGPALSSVHYVQVSDTARGLVSAPGFGEHAGAVRSLAIQILQATDQTLEAEAVAQWRRVAEAVRRGEVDESIDLVTFYVDALLRAGRFEDCDRWLARADVPSFDAYVSVAVLAATKPASARLRMRSTIVRRVRDHVVACWPERAERLLVGLE